MVDHFLLFLHTIYFLSLLAIMVDYLYFSLGNVAPAKRLLLHTAMWTSVCVLCDDISQSKNDFLVFCTFYQYILLVLPGYYLFMTSSTCICPFFFFHNCNFLLCTHLLISIKLLRIKSSLLFHTMWAFFILLLWYPPETFLYCL